MIVKDFSNTSTFSNIVISAKNISHKFDYTLFEDLNLDLHQGEVASIVGVSGSGKSTILHILATLLKPQKGEVFYGSHSLYNLSIKNQTNLRRKDIGIIFQSHYLFKGFTVKENLTISSLISKKDIDMKLLEKFQIEHTLKQNVSELSGGQQQRVSIARVLTKKPKIIFADEPTGNLDSQTAREVMDEMIKYIKDINGTMLIVTHDKNIASMSDTVYELKDKKLTRVYANNWFFNW